MQAIIVAIITKVATTGGNLMELIGHVNTKKRIAQALASAIHRNEALPHMLFSGHPGCGKTSLAKEVANLTKTDFISVMPETLKDFKAIRSLMNSLNYDGYNERGDCVDKIKPSIIFLDEIHRLPIFGQEKLGIIMEEFKMDTGRPNKYYWAPYFTIIGATTLAGELSRPFLNRFKLNFMFQPYSYKESVQIVYEHAKRLKINVVPTAAEDIAKRGRGVPRVMLGYLECCRDTALFNKITIVSHKTVNATFEDLGIDGSGFTKTEIKILETLYNSERPVGLETLAIVTNESAKTIKNELEPYLMQSGYMMRSGAGRVITANGRLYLEDKGYQGKAAGRVEISADYVRKQG